MSTTANREIDWIQRDRRVIEGLDHLGVSLVSVNLYQAMLPGITNVTERARYYSFYPWVVHRFAQHGQTTRSKAAWRNWLRNHDFTYAAACLAHEAELNRDLRSSLVGADLARKLIKGASPTTRIDLRRPSAVLDSGSVPAKGAYFQNPEGGLGQYYKGPLRDLGVLVEHDSASWPNVKLSNYAGALLARTLDEEEAFEQLTRIATEGSATLQDLAAVGREVHPQAIDPQSEEADLLRTLFFGSDSSISQGQQIEHIQPRRDSLFLMLHFLDSAESVDANHLSYEFLWSCSSGYLPDGKAWTIPPDLVNTCNAWAAYQRNDLLTYSLECVFYVALQELDRAAARPADLISSLVHQAIETPLPEVGSLVPEHVGEWVQSTALTQEAQDDDPWGAESTWRLAVALETSVAEGQTSMTMALAVRLLGRLASDRGNYVQHPFECIPNAAEMASNHDVHLQRWWDRIKERSTDDTRSFLTTLFLEWIVYRHLRVATRKLANQGVSTYKYRPEEGYLLLTGERLPEPSFASPRVRQAFRIMEDLHCIDRADGHASLSTLGRGILGTRRARHD